MGSITDDLYTLSKLWEVENVIDYKTFPLMVIRNKY